VYGRMVLRVCWKHKPEQGSRIEMDVGRLERHKHETAVSAQQPWTIHKQDWQEANGNDGGGVGPVQLA
jgi:hypothetical protein